MAASTESTIKRTSTERSVQKRKKDDIHQHVKSNTQLSNIDENSPIISAFRVYQKELDMKHDKYERLVKLSRDVTIQSKRVIFLLHRINSDDKREAILKEADEKINEIGLQLQKITMELEDEDPYKFLRAYTNGLQEYIEAISFYEYLLCKNLLTLGDAEARLTFNVANKQDSKKSDIDCPTDTVSEPIETKELQLHLPPLEYVLGLADLTGELMRCCINSIGNGDIDRPFELLTFMREMYEGFSLFSRSASRELRQKMETMRQSLMKVENTCYMLQVRGSEIPKHMLLDAITVEPQVEPSC